MTPLDATRLIQHPAVATHIFTVITLNKRKQNDDTR